MPKCVSFHDQCDSYKEGTRLIQSLPLLSFGRCMHWHWELPNVLRLMATYALEEIRTQTTWTIRSYRDAIKILKKITRQPDMLSIWIFSFVSALLCCAPNEDVKPRCPSVMDTLRPHFAFSSHFIGMSRRIEKTGDREIAHFRMSDSERRRGGSIEITIIKLQ